MDIRNLFILPLEDIERARVNLAGQVLKTPLIPLNNYSEQGKKIYLKLESLQAFGSFKIRGAWNAVKELPSSVLDNGIYTASAGSFAQPLAWIAKKLNVPCSVIANSYSSEVKIAATRRLGADVIQVPMDTWMRILETRRYNDMPGYFIHPCCDWSVIAGNGTMGLEILEDLPEVDSIICPYGGGGCSTGIASAVKAIKPATKIFVCEPETAFPLAESFKAGKPTSCTNYQPSFVDGMQGKSVLPDIWNLARSLIDTSVVVSLREIADAVKLLVENNKVVAEGAGAATVAAALRPDIPDGNVVCVVSGGNINNDALVKILKGEIPTV